MPETNATVRARKATKMGHPAPEGEEICIKQVLEVVLKQEDSVFWERVTLDTVRVALGFDVLYAGDIVASRDPKKSKRRRAKAARMVKTGGVDLRGHNKDSHEGPWYDRSQKGQL